MIDRNDLRAAVSAGYVTESQAANLISLADSRRGARENLDPGDEPFELFKGFNEIFIVVGLIILALGWSAVTAVALGDTLVSAANVMGTAVMLGAVTGGVIWLLSEYFIRRRRMVAPAIALSIFFGINAAVTWTVALFEPFMFAQGDLSSVPLPMLLGTLTMAVYWWRFRVPFAMAVIAVGLFLTAMVYTATLAGTVDTFDEFFLLSAEGPFAWVTLGLGLLVFLAAMAFDMSDPHRVTRRSGNGFWLHVVAAPALVNTIALSLLAQESPMADVILLAVLAFFALVAIVIDRRSFLIAAIGYVVVLAGTVLDGGGAAYTVLLLGVVLVALGAFWERIRAVLLRPLSGILPLHRLPPAQL